MEILLQVLSGPSAIPMPYSSQGCMHVCALAQAAHYHRIKSLIATLRVELKFFGFKVQPDHHYTMRRSQWDTNAWSTSSVPAWGRAGWCASRLAAAKVQYRPQRSAQSASPIACNICLQHSSIRAARQVSALTSRSVIA